MNISEKTKEVLKDYLIKISKGQIKDVFFELIYPDRITIGLKVDWDDIPFDRDGSGDLYMIDRYLTREYKPQIQLFMDMTGNKKLRNRFRIKNVGLYDERYNS